MAGCATKSYDVHSRRPRYYVAAMANLYQSSAGDPAASDDLARIISFSLQLLPVKFPPEAAPTVLQKLVLYSRLPSNVVGKKDSTGSPPPVPPPSPEPPPQAPKLFTCIR